MVPAAEQQAAADSLPAACHLLTAAVARQLQAATVRLWVREQSVSAFGQEQAMVWAGEQQAAVDLRPVACRLPAAAGVRPILAAAARLWFPGRSVSALVQV